MRRASEAMTDGAGDAMFALKTMWWSGRLFGSFDWGIPPNANWAADEANTHRLKLGDPGIGGPMHMNSREAS